MNRYLKQLVLMGLLISPSLSFAELRHEVYDQEPFTEVIHHFDLRIRNDLFNSGALTNDLKIAPGGHDLGDKNQVVAGNFRLRYLPTFRVGDNLRINTDVTLLASELYHSIDSSGTEAIFENNVHVRTLEVQWQPLPQLWVRLGRISQHFGLGLVEHDASCIDCDFDTVQDGASLQLNVGALSGQLGYYWPGEGPSSDWVPAHELENTSEGQPYDLAQNDDVGLWHFGLSSKRFTPIQEKERIRLAKEKNDWLYDWHIRLRRRTADFASDRFQVGGVDKCPGDATVPCSGTSYDDFPFIPRWLTLWTPGLFFEFRVWPKPNHYLDLGIELEGNLGSVERSQSDPDIDSERSIRSLAGALKARYHMGDLFIKFDSGFATGDPERKTFGVRSNTSSSQAAFPEGDYYAEDDDSYRNNETWEQFVFHRNFHVDKLLFREIIGGVSNAAYLRPAIGYDLSLGDMSLESELGVTASWALSPEATPGQQRYYGLETGLDLRLKLWGTTQVHLGGALLLPGGALEGPANLDPIGTVWTGQLDLFVQY